MVGRQVKQFLLAAAFICSLSGIGCWDSPDPTTSNTLIQTPMDTIDLKSFYSFSDTLTAVYEEKGMPGLSEFVAETLQPGKVFWFSEDEDSEKLLIYDRAIYPIDSASRPMDDQPILPRSQPRDYRNIMSIFKKREFSPPCQVEIYSTKLEE